MIKPPLHHTVKPSVEIARILIRTGLVERQEVGKTVLYRLTPDGEDALRLLDELACMGGCESC